MTDVRKGQASARLDRTAFSARFREAWFDPAFRNEDQSIARLEDIAWEIYLVGRKSPITRKAGPGYVDPEYDLSVTQPTALRASIMAFDCSTRLAK